MRDLTRSDTLRASLLWALLTTAAAYPRLAAWLDRPKALWFLVVILGLSSFVLWAFVFAWLPRLDPQPVLRGRQTGGDCFWAIVGGVLGAVFLVTFVDPELRRITPQDYPDSLGAWVIGSLFTLGFVQLFLCFAPLAFFLRLLPDRWWALGATLVFGVFLLVLQLRATEPAPSLLFAALLIGWRLVSGGFALWLLARGGPVLVWLWVVLLQARLVPGLIRGQP